MRRYWTTSEVALLRELYPKTLNRDLAVQFGRTKPAVNQMAVKLGLRKYPEFMAAECRFQRGNRPWNAGKKGWNPKGSKATQFKKGRRGPRQRPVGTERRERDGVWVKVAEPNVWEAKPRYVWRREFGPVPDGYCVRLKDGDKENCSPENLMLVSRQENARLNAAIRKPKRKPVAAWVVPLSLSL